MPFDCGLEQGRIKLSPTAERSYPIIDGHEAQAVTVCNPRLSAACRTIMAHRFDIACGGARLAWMRVAAAIRQAGSAPAWIKDGRLNVVLPVKHAGDGKPSCMERPTFSLGRTSKDGVAARDCRPRLRDDFDLVALPHGFAPVSELGARLALATATDSSPPSGPALEMDGAGDEPVLARGDPDAIIDPITGEPDTYDAGQRAHEWITVVRAEGAAGIRARHRAVDAAGIWTWFLTAMLFASAAGLVRVRMVYARTKELCPPVRWQSVFGQRAMRLWWDRRNAQPSRRFTNAGGAVTSLLDGTESVVAGLKDAGPLREVLQEELALVRRHVSSVDAEAGEAELSAAKTAAQFRGLVRELERIRRIADSAAASLAGARPGAGLPRTTSEAYAVLGVNADVSAPVLKKIVDALRMSWHPDHARGEDDRRLREERIRQINIAWELISARRVEA